MSNVRRQQPTSPFIYGDGLNPALYNRPSASSLPPYHPDYVHPDEYAEEEEELDEDDIPLATLHTRRDSRGEMAVRALDRESLLYQYPVGREIRDDIPDVLAANRYNVYEAEVYSDDSWDSD